MATYQPGASGDDGNDGTGFDNTNVNTEMGDNGTANMRSFFRFPNVTIPTGQTIDTCTVTFTARFDNSQTTCNLNVYFWNADNPAAPANSTDMNTAFAAATSAAAWSGVGAWTSGNTTNAITPDLSSILQTVVNRAGWASGNALVCLIQNNASSTNAERRPYTFDGSSSLCALLTVTFHGSGGGGVADQSRLMLMGVQ